MTTIKNRAGLVVGLVIVIFFNISLMAKSLVVLTNRSDFHLKKLTAQYAETHNIDVKVHYVKHGLISFLKAHREDVDVVIVKNSSTIIQASKLGLLLPIPEQITSKLKSHFVAKDRTWFNMSYRLRSFVLRKDIVSFPTSYIDLANPKWKGQICMRKFTHDYNIELFGAMYLTLGEKAFKMWLKGLKYNLARKPQGNDRAQAKAVAEGKCSIGIMNTYYMGLMLQNSEQREWASKLNLYIPNQEKGGAVALYSGVGISNLTRNTSDSFEFVKYLLNPINQQFMSSINYEYPIIGKSGSKMVQSFGDYQGLKMEDIKILPISQEDIASVREKVLQIIHELE